MIKFWTTLSIILLFISKSLSEVDLSPKIDEAIALKEAEIIHYVSGTVTYSITNNQNKKYFHLVKEPGIKDYKLYDEESNEISGEKYSDYDVFFPIANKDILYLVLYAATSYCRSFIFADDNKITLKPNEEYKYPFFTGTHTFETKLTNTKGKYFILYMKYSNVNPELPYDLYINDVKHSPNSGDNEFKILINSDAIIIKITVRQNDCVATMKYLLTSYFNITENTLECSSETGVFKYYYIKKPTINSNYYWYSLSNKNVEYYVKNNLISGFHDFNSYAIWNVEEYYILMKDKGCFQIKYFSTSTDYILINNQESILVSDAESYSFKYLNSDNKNMELYIYSTENNFINKTKVVNSYRSLDIKKDNDKFYYYFLAGNDNEIIFVVNFNLNEKEYMIIDIKMEEHEGKSDENTDESSDENSDESSDENSDESSDKNTDENSDENSDESSDENTDNTDESTQNNTEIEQTNNNNTNTNNNDNSDSLVAVWICVPIGVIIIALSIFLIIIWKKRKNGEDNNKTDKEKYTNNSKMTPMVEIMKS